MAKTRAKTTRKRPSKPAAKAPAQVVRVVRARYDAAQTTHDNARHWAASDALSAAAANAKGVREIIKRRARYETANNGIAHGIVGTLANDIVGTGPRWQIAGNRDALLPLVRAWQRWSDEINLADKLRTMRRAQCVDGEAFAVIATNRGLRSAVQLDVMPIDSDRVTDDTLSFDPTYADGIQYDAFGNPVTYRVLNYHPTEASLSPPSEMATNWPARNVIHLFKADRPGQLRGISELVSTLGLFAELRRYTLAVLAAAETAADFAWFLKSTSPEIQASDATPFDTVEIERRMGQVLPAGWDVSQLKAEQPTTAYSDFRFNLVGEAARPLHMPVNVAMADSSKSSYASSRMDHIPYERAIRIDRDMIDRRALDKIAYAWLDEAALIPGLLPAGLPPFSEWDWKWVWPGFENSDPTKDANATGSRLLQHTTTLRDEYEKDGEDWVEQLQQRAQEIALMNELGIPMTTQSGAVIGEQQQGAGANA